LYIRIHAKGHLERGHEGKLGLHHAARKWAHVVHPLWHLVGAQVYAFGLNSFSLKTFMVFSLEFISEVTCMTKDRKEFCAKKQF
jgi:hypothetical protein